MILVVPEMSMIAQMDSECPTFYACELCCQFSVFKDTFGKDRENTSLEKTLLAYGISVLYFTSLDEMNLIHLIFSIELWL